MKIEGRLKWEQSDGVVSKVDETLKSCFQNVFLRKWVIFPSIFSFYTFTSVPFLSIRSISSFHLPIQFFICVFFSSAFSTVSLSTFTMDSAYFFFSFVVFNFNCNFPNAESAQHAFRFHFFEKIKTIFLCVSFGSFNFISHFIFPFLYLEAKSSIGGRNANNNNNNNDNIHGCDNDSRLKENLESVLT